MLPGTRIQNVDFPKARKGRLNRVQNLKVAESDAFLQKKVTRPCLDLNFNVQYLNIKV